MRSGAILNRSGERYKPSTVRSYEQDFGNWIIPKLGSARMASLRRVDVQDFVEHLRRQGLSASSVHNKLDPLRVLTRRALDRGELLVDPFQRLSLPAVRNTRTRVEAPARALELIEALPVDQRAYWALAFFAGLRRGELRALRCEDVDFDGERIVVCRGWDDQEGEIPPKSFAGARVVPMSRDPLRAILRAHKLATGRNGSDLFLGRAATLPFVPSTARSRARAAWEEAKLEPITAHEARHCAASYFIACGWDWKKVAEYVGHSDVRTTFNRYGKLVPGDEEAAVVQLDAYLARKRAG
jgi:integrase